MFELVLVLSTKERFFKVGGCGSEEYMCLTHDSRAILNAAVRQWRAPQTPEARPLSLAFLDLRMETKGWGTYLQVCLIM